MRYCLCLLLGMLAAPVYAQGFDKAALAWKLPWDVDWVTAVCFVSPTRVVAGNARGELLVWDLPAKLGEPAPMPVRRLDGHTNAITRLLLTPDGRWLISASYDHTIRYWDMQAAPSKKDTVIMNVHSIEDAPLRKKKPPEPLEAKVEVQEAAKVLTGHKDWVMSLSLSQDGKTLLSGDERGEVVVWDAIAAKEQRRWKVKGWVWAVALSPNGESAVVSERMPLVFDSGSHTGVKLWNVRTGEMKADLNEALKKQRFAAAAYSADGSVIAVGRGGETDSGKVTLLEAATGKLIKELTPGHYSGLTDLQFHPDGKHVLSCGRDTTVRIWEIASGKLVKELGQGRGGQFKDQLHAISVSADSRWLAAADMAYQVQIWTLPK